MWFLCVIFVLLGVLAPIQGYNLSPHPNHIFQEPQSTKSFVPAKNQSSYFGYSINLRPSSVIVGAPRAVPWLETQRNIREPGAIYKCDITDNSCNFYTFEKLGNLQVEHNPMESETRDYQWLGASIDGPGRDDGRLVVCAPRNFINLRNENYLLNGLCYWISNTTAAQPQGVKKITPFRDVSKQAINNEYIYLMAEGGFSVHVTEDEEEIIIGAVGVFNWMGSVAQYKRVSFDVGLSRRETSDTFNTNHDTSSGPFSYASKVPNPKSWGQQADSYFGYAVGSGFFTMAGSEMKKMLYVASAPRVDEVYLFDIVDQPDTFQEKTIKKYQTFSGEQMGEYFGATVLVEDFNGDGQPDLAVGAPYHRHSERDNGAVYVFNNLGNAHFSENALKLVTDYELDGKFGLSLGKIGDINLDGFNDLAVGAPYEDNGAVYIFLGNQQGLQRKSVQKIVSPGGNRLFGYSISRGVDIDHNGYGDVAIGAPDTETVLIYRTYPVIKVIASITPQNRELDIKDTTLKFNTCWMIQSPTTFPDNVQLQIRIKADQQYGRVTFEDGTSVQEFQVNPRNYDQCKIFDVEVRSKTEYIFKPIDLEMSWQVMDNTPSEVGFCDHCVYLNPNDPSFARSQVVFNTGCENIPCRADLKITGTLHGPEKYILNSVTSFRLQLDVTNDGETAYLPRLSIEKKPGLNFMKILPNCDLDDDVMTCNFPEPLPRGKSQSLTFRFDPTSLESGDEISISANVSSTGDEANPEDNTKEFSIPIVERSEVEIVGRSTPQFVAIRDREDRENVTYVIEYRNLGPTHLMSNSHVEAKFEFPIALHYQDRWINFIHFSNITSRAVYKSYILNVDWSQNGTILLQNPTEYTTSFPIIADELNAINYDSAKMGLDVNIDVRPDDVDHNPDSDFNIFNRRRRRRDLESTVTFNPYTLSLREEQFSNAKDLDDAILGSRINKTIFLDCNQLNVMCLTGSMRIPSTITPKDSSIVLRLTFPVDLKAVNSVLDERRDSLLLSITTSMTRSDDAHGNMVTIVEKRGWTHFVQDIPAEVQIWIIIVSVIGGLLLLTIISYVLYRLGFFKREKKAEIARLVRESQIQSAMSSEEDDD
ncbi:Integrin alpha-PS3 [Sergentomyia squamirostris]